MNGKARQDKRDRDDHGCGENRNAAAGDTAVYKIPAIALAARLAPACALVDARHGRAAVSRPPSHATVAACSAAYALQLAGSRYPPVAADADGGWQR